MRQHRREQGRRSSKASGFLYSAETLPHLAIWLACARPLIRLHFHFFTKGKHLGEKEGTDDAFEFVDMSRSPAVKVLRSFYKSMDPGSDEHKETFSLLISMFGPVAQWPDNVTLKARQAILATVSSVWRRMVHSFLCYPWRCARMCDAKLTEEERTTARQEFLDVPECCLDWHFSRKLRLHHHT
eukprot:9344995-Karenia_brevis.AAC.1